MAKPWVKIYELMIDLTMDLNNHEILTLQEYSAYLSSVRERLGTPIIVSKNSGIRTVEYEKSKGRSGKSEHSTYHLKGRGAVDLVYYKALFDELVSDKWFTRICYYPNNGFIHCDRKPHDMEGIQYFEASSPTANWRYIKQL